MRIRGVRLAGGVGIIALLCACAIQIPAPQPSPPQPSPSHSTPSQVVLSGQGAAGHAFGAPVATVEASLRDALGEPSQVTENTGCPLNPIWTRTVRWQGLSVSFQGKTERRTDATTLSTWQLRNDQGVPSNVALADGLPVTTTFAQLIAAHPGTELTEQLGWYLAEPVPGITYMGSSRTEPEMINGGPLQWCE